MKNRFLGLVILPVLVSCSAGQDKINTQIKIIDNIESHIIIPTHQLLCERVSDLQGAIQRIEIGNDISLLQARDAWVETRELWEQAEGYAIKESKIVRIRQRMDESTYPLSQQQPDRINRGEFQQIEYILWGADGMRMAADLTETDLASLLTISDSMVVQTNQLLAFAKETAWTKAKLKARNEEQRSQICQQRIKDYVGGMIGVTQQILDTKITEPDAPIFAVQIEEPYSDNTKSDILNNIIAIENLYTGRLDLHKGAGIAAVVDRQDKVLDETLRKSIEDSKKAINALPESYSMALSNDRDAVLVAKVKLQTLQELLKDRLLPLVSQI
ncbi:MULTISPECIES: imelysin family protein [unclassified Sphingobacterium]|uniref:imelysin family protein n=1 Tax=unclassified Sphingobacterium TaxID=2609468 RepID=UPI0025E20D1B|nr:MULTISPECIES: imelysin family protein [unclassified Sphingobacterium]